MKKYILFCFLFLLVTFTYADADTKEKLAKQKENLEKLENYMEKLQKQIKIVNAKMQKTKNSISQLENQLRKEQNNNATPTKVNINLTSNDLETLEEIRIQKSLKIDYNKIVSSQKCGDCHSREFSVWKETPHSTTYDKLHKRPRAKKIAERMGLASTIKRSDICYNCHYTRQEVRGEPKVISGVSCESCHGAGVDWLNIHNEKSIPKLERRIRSMEKGMNNPEDIYLIAQNCYQCHSVPNEELVNKGGHNAGSPFEFVRWSQGMIRHNFVRTNDNTNAKTSQQRIRVMFVVGAMLDLEYGLRGIALATTKGRYLSAMTERTNIAYKRLLAIQQRTGIAEVELLLVLFKELNFNNKESIVKAADYITLQARKFTKNHDGSKLTTLDRVLPLQENYMWKPSRK